LSGHGPASTWLPIQKLASVALKARRQNELEGSNKKSYFTKIGAAWPTKSGSGYNADLIALPVDGKFILLPQTGAGPEGVLNVQKISSWLLSGQLTGKR
jgi:hypothetical protein